LTRSHLELTIRN